MSAVTERRRLIAETIFSRVLVGVDGSASSMDAARQAAALADGQLTLLAAYDLAPAVVGGTGFGIPAYFDEGLQRHAAEEVLAQTRLGLGDSTVPAKVARGPVWDALIEEANHARTTMIAVGAHGAGRLAGVVLGSVATEIVHKAPCSVLVARPWSDVLRRIVVGIDGSPESADAYAVALHLAARFDAELWPVVAHGGKVVDRVLVDRIVERREELPDHPVTALVAASAEADLVVVGSRGLHGIPSLGSVSERVAHNARSSVLAVR